MKDQKLVAIKMEVMKFHFLCPQMTYNSDLFLNENSKQLIKKVLGGQVSWEDGNMM